LAILVFSSHFFVWFEWIHFSSRIIGGTNRCHELGKKFEFHLYKLCFMVHLSTPIYS